MDRTTTVVLTLLGVVAIGVAFAIGLMVGETMVMREAVRLGLAEKVVDDVPLSTSSVYKWIEQ